MKLKESDLTASTKSLTLRPFTGHDYNRWRAGVLGRSKKKQSADDLPGPKVADITKEKYRAWLKLDRKARKKDLIYTWGIFTKDSQ